MVENEWGIEIVESSVEEGTGRSGGAPLVTPTTEGASHGAMLPEGLTFAFERASETSQSNEETVQSTGADLNDLMAQLKNL